MSRTTRVAELSDTRFIASTHGGLGAAVGVRRVAPSIAWAEPGAMVEGARIASRAAA